MRPSPRLASLALLLAPALAASPSAASAAPDGFAERARGGYVPSDAVELVDPKGPSYAGPPHILFLNRCTGGETIQPGYDDSTTNHSSILSGPVDFPEFPYGDGSWGVVMENSRELFAPFNIQVTDVDPSPSPHDEVIVCGAAEQAGFAGAGGVAPFACGIIDNPITYVFAETMGNQPEAIAIVIGQEAAHAWGLDHEYKCDDPMTYLQWCGDVAFQQGAYPCGEYSERTCSCGGNTQNSYQMILEAFGAGVPDTQSPIATVTSPTDGATFDVGAEFMIAVDVTDDVQVVEVTLYINGQPQGSDSSEPFGPWPALDTPEGTYDIYVEATDFAGNVGTSNTVTIEVGLGGASGGSASAGDSGGSASAGDSGGVDTADGGSDPDGGGGGSGGATADDDGVLPPAFGIGNDDALGCACTAQPTGDDALPWLGLWIVWASRRRRRA